MWSNQDQTGCKTGTPAESYVYPPALAPGAARPVAQSGGSSTLERLCSSEKTACDSFMGNADTGDEQIRARIEEQIRTREARARKEGQEEGAKQARAEYDKKLNGQRETVAQAVKGFAQEQETYFNRVEAEVVGLALAIARKILHREAQVDPLLLAGVVRVGLDKVAAGTHVRLRVHPDQVPFWQESLAQQPDLRSVPELMGDATLQPGHCRLETEHGSTDLTLETQLKEIEQGFFDLLAQRPSKHS
jgi:flagellar biosynthesis/type III secretory pathway protein FliH